MEIYLQLLLILFMAEVDKDKEKIKGEEVKEDIKKMRYSIIKNHHFIYQC